MQALALPHRLPQIPSANACASHSPGPSDLHSEHAVTSMADSEGFGIERNLQAAGMIKVMHASVMSEELACAAVIWKVDS